MLSGYLKISMPPLPHYISSGEVVYRPGEIHISRYNLGIFDLIMVTKGTLFMGEDERLWDVQAGQTLLLRPDRFHFGAKACVEDTHFFWIAFHTAGNWFGHDIPLTDEQSVIMKSSRQLGLSLDETFSLILPQYHEVINTSRLLEQFRLMRTHEMSSQVASRIRQQQIFQNILLFLYEETLSPHNPSMVKVSEMAVSYLRQNYRQPFSYQELSKNLHFHQGYIARCMKKVHGCTLLEYLNSYRIERAKQLLYNSGLSIQRIAEEVGFPNPIYFTRCFTKSEGMSPQMFRKRTISAETRN